MAPVQGTRRVKMKASKRALKFLADQAIGHDLFKGLIELITNSDDSYGRLEAGALPANGRIEVEIDRREVQADLHGRQVDLEHLAAVREDDRNRIAPLETEGSQAVGHLVGGRQQVARPDLDAVGVDERQVVGVLGGDLPEAEGHAYGYPASGV